MRRRQMIMLAAAETKKAKKKDLKTICLHNRAKLFGEKKIEKTKEE